MTLDLIIERLKKEYSFSDYRLRQGVIPYSQFSDNRVNPLVLSQSDIIIVTGLTLIGYVANSSDIANKLVILDNNKSDSDVVDYADLVTFRDIDGLTQVESNYISVHRGTLNIVFPAQNMFSSVYRGSLSYLVITPQK